MICEELLSSFDATNGVRRVCLISPSLFNFVMDEAMEDPLEVLRVYRQIGKWREAVWPK